MIRPHAAHLTDLPADRSRRRHTQALRRRAARLVRRLRSTDADTADHSERVARLSVRLGRRLGMGPVELAHLRRAARLHDVGKLMIPREILQQPRALTPAERGIVDRHAEIGADIVRGEHLPARESQWIRLHHVHYGRRGPAGPSGPRVPLAARILAVADAYDAMTHDRPYSPTMTHREAITELRRCSGRQFDPRLVDVFCQQPVPSEPAVA